MDRERLIRAGIEQDAGETALPAGYRACFVEMERACAGAGEAVVGLVVEGVRLGAAGVDAAGADGCPAAVVDRSGRLQHHGVGAVAGAVGCLAPTFRVREASLPGLVE